MSKLQNARDEHFTSCSHFFVIGNFSLRLKTDKRPKNVSNKATLVHNLLWESNARNIYRYRPYTKKYSRTNKK